MKKSVLCFTTLLLKLSIHAAELPPVDQFDEKIHAFFAKADKFETARLIWHKILHEEQKEDLKQIYDDPTCEQWLWGFAARSKTLDERIERSLKRHLTENEKSNPISWLLKEKTSAKTVGIAGFDSRSFDASKAELSIALAAPFRQQKFGTEILIELARIAFVELHVKLIIGGCFKGNTAIRNLVEKYVAPNPESFEKNYENFTDDGLKPGGYTLTYEKWQELQAAIDHKES